MLAPNSIRSLSRVPLLPVNLRRLKRPREERGVISTDDIIAAVHVAELEHAHRLGHDSLQLHISKLLANTPVPSGAEGKVGRGCSLADQAVTVVNLLLFLLLVANDTRGERGVLLPPVGLPEIGLGEVLRVGSTDTGGGKEDVVGRDDILGSGDGHRAFDGAHNGVDRGVQTEGLLDDGLVKRELGEIFVLKRGEISAEVLDLFLVEFFHNVGARGETKHDPGASGRRGVLASHQESDHHVGDLVVGNLDTVLVLRVHQMPHDILRFLLILTAAARLDGIHVDLSDGPLGVVATVVPGKRGPVKHEVDRRETHVEIVVKGSKRLVELATDLLALERMRGGEDGDLGHLGRNVDNAGFALEIGALLEVARDLIRDDGNVGLESLRGERDLHELLSVATSQHTFVPRPKGQKRV